MRDQVDVLLQSKLWHSYSDLQKLELQVSKAFQGVKHYVIKEHAKYVYILSVVLCDDQFIKDLNNTYRGKNAATNCLSFPSAQNIMVYEEGKPTMLGEIILSFETLSMEAKMQKKSMQDHFIHLMVHSLLHLFGFDHQDQVGADLMEISEIKILNKYFGISNPYQNLSEETDRKSKC